MCELRRQRTRVDVVVAVAVMLLLRLSDSLEVDAAASHGSCPSSCRCTDGSTVVVSCAAVTRVPSLLPPSTVRLHLDHNHISLLTNASFQQALRRLEELSLEDNGLLHVECGALVSLTELRVLKLGRNHLSSLPATVFAANRKLELLDVHANYFALLPDAVLRHVYSLTTLNVSFNHLTSPRLGPGFRYTTQLSHIDLSGQYIGTIHCSTRFCDQLSLSVCLCVCKEDKSNSCRRIMTKFCI